MCRVTRHGLIAAIAFVVCVVAAAEGELSPEWVGAWVASSVPMAVSANQSSTDVTYRNIVHIGLGGNTVRVQLTNEFGATSLHVEDAHIAMSGTGDAIQRGTDHALTFNGSSAVSIPAGGIVVSDPVPMQTGAGEDLAMSIYLPAQPLAIKTCHSESFAKNYMAPGNSATAASFESAKTVEPWCFLKAVDVRGNRNAFAIVAFGDSITDGAGSTENANHRWPDYLSRRLQANKKIANTAVLNEGIVGNRLLHDGFGPSAIARFDRDVLAQSGVKYLIVLEGINDISQLKNPKTPDDIISVSDLIFGLTQLITRAHQHGIKVYGATLTPYEGSRNFSTVGEQMRQAVNRWIRTSGAFDGVIDFDKTTRDAQNPARLFPPYDCGDHLHPSDAGYKAMADSIDLRFFR
jgi:lysophospholipase L1-like esterase